MLQLLVLPYAGKDFASFLRPHLLLSHKMLRPRLRELTVVLVGDRRMSELHERFMGIAGPTDVLTFPTDTDAQGQPLTGEVVVCVPEARRQARQRGTDPRNEVLLYALHGLLHLAGYDDRTTAAYERMHCKEDEILQRLGVGPVFRPEPKGRSKPRRPAVAARSRRRRTSAEAD